MRKRKSIIGDERGRRYKRQRQRRDTKHVWNELSLELSLHQGDVKVLLILQSTGMARHPTSIALQKGQRVYSNVTVFKRSQIKIGHRRQGKAEPKAR